MSAEMVASSVEKFMGTQKTRRTLGEYVSELEVLGRLTPTVQEAVDKAERLTRENDFIFYLAGALTGVSEEMKARYGQVGDLITTHQKPGAKMFGYAPHLHGTDPIAHPDVSPEEVRDIDYIFAAVVADGHFNFMYPLAHGNAVEEAWAEAANIPAVYLMPESMYTSRLIRGMHNILSTIIYTDFETDGLPQVAQLLDGIERATK
ncbi:MAG TPA: hypothetical protein VLF60_04880 [Candidatus Saccharimonadales bacterium]|nr:hypothetical protein [Candidatus Saccharimonadales bacterium]